MNLDVSMGHVSASLNLTPTVDTHIPSTYRFNQRKIVSLNETQPSMNGCCVLFHRTRHFTYVPPLARTKPSATEPSHQEFVEPSPYPQHIKRDEQS
jgi:hypothetical protein